MDVFILCWVRYYGSRGGGAETREGEQPKAGTAAGPRPPDHEHPHSPKGASKATVVGTHIPTCLFNTKKSLPRLEVLSEHREPLTFRSNNNRMNNLFVVLSICPRSGQPNFASCNDERTNVLHAASSDKQDKSNKGSVAWSHIPNNTW